jgi:polysaccharide biosynthesis transport protein
MAESSENPLLQYLTGIRRRWLLVALVAASLFALLGPFAAGLPYIFQSKATLLVDQLPGVAQPGASGELDGRLQTIRAEALSRQRITEMAEQFDLYPGLRGPESLETLMVRFNRDARVDITSTSSSEGNPRAVAFTVSYMGSNAKTAAEVANRLALFYVEKNDAMRSKQVTQTAEFFRDRLVEVRRRLELAEQRVINFTSTNAGTLTRASGTTLAQYGTLTALHSQYSNEHVRLMTRKDDLTSQIADLTSPRPTVGLPDASDPTVRLATAQNQLAGMRLKGWRDNHPEVKAKLNEIAVLKTQIKQSAIADDDGPAGGSGSRLAMLQNQLAQVNADLASLQTKQEALGASQRRFDRMFAEAPVRDAEFDKLNRDLTTTRDEYESLQRRLQEATMNERAETTKSGEEFHVLDPALPSSTAAAPNKKVLLVASALLSIGLALGLAVALEWLDSSFRSVDELRQFTHVPVLATIPTIVTRRDRWRSALKKVSILIIALVALSGVAVVVFQSARGFENVTRLMAR